jgi:uncharacterized protein with PIN domain
MSDAHMIEGPAAREPRFEVDAMLIKLARYLRCLGYDAQWGEGESLATRIERADAEGRVFLTRNHNVGHQQRLPRNIVFVRGDDPVAQVQQLVDELRLEPRARMFTRCIRCNVALVEVAKDQLIAARVPARTFATYAHFYACPSCGTVFWKGSHVRNTCRKLRMPDVSE